MRIGRRDFLTGMGLAGGALGMGTLGPAALGIGEARAEGLPQNIDFIIPYGPGGGFDQYVHAILPAFQDQLPDSISIRAENVEGASGAKGANQLARATPDGSTIAIVNVPGIIIVQLRGGLSFDVGGLTWLCNMGNDPYGLAVPAKSPLKSIADLRALGRKRPVTFTGVGPAGAAYSATRIGAHLLGFEAEIISGYKGTNDYIVAAVRGDGDATVGSLTALSQFHDSGMIRVLATFEKHSSIPGAEDATTLGQPDLAKITQLRPVAGPPKLPQDIAARLSRYLINAMNDPKVAEWAKANRANLQPSDATTTKRLIEEQVAFMNVWKKYIN
ncbi:MAG TPA: tripartite tricarboxylate transporter substrate-binding protein [Stellaceae bacterium]|jgi:tripartite-type tricarboxylate transporter receptor subunit TctC|nr:tripartite tricarboxylate transporter substrate-binding protein [Stellaceae bacterium]